MKILSHRGRQGFYKEQDQSIAFERLFSLGFSAEIDIRDRDQELVISHDISTINAIKLEHFLKISVNAKPQEQLTIAFNVKADGLAGLLKRALVKYPQLDSFVFDMAVPDMRSYFNAGVPVFTRMSEVEQEPAWLDRSTGVWLDGFESEWYDVALIENLVRLKKRVCIVSPELHQRSHESLWARLKSIDHNQLMLCTDCPEAAAAYFL